jgi:hypothetical protein
MWIPLREVVARAGTLKRVRARLAKGDVTARAAAFLPTGMKIPEGHIIPPEWWSDAKIDPAASRATFVMHWFEVTAIGIELEPGAVEALWPVRPKRQKAPPKPERETKPKASKPVRMPGRELSPVWTDIFQEFDPVANNKPYPSLGRAVDAVGEWLQKRNKVLSRSAIKRGIRKHRPRWFAGGA